jgi:AraC-like DNA-binding protein
VELPDFSIFRFGISHSVNPTEKKNDRKERMASYYEFEFYDQDATGGCCLDGTLYPAKEGYCTVAKPGQRVLIVPPYKCYFINISTNDPQLSDLFDHLPANFPLWNVQKVIRIIREMVTVESSRDLAYRVLLQSCACRIIALLAECRQTAQPEMRSVFMHQQMLLEVDQYMRENLSQPLTLETLAKRCNLDPTYFHKLYTAAYGKTPAQRLLNYRIIEAQRGLIADNQPMHELAARCGFSSQAYFCYKFKQVTGKTPAQYRKDIRSELK